MRLRTCTKIHQDVLFSKRGDGIASIKRRRSDLPGDGVWILATASQRRYDVSVPALTKDNKGNKSNTPYPGKAIRRIQAIWE
ncbi:MAK10-like protein [Tanacetum coccineum]